VGAVTAAVRPAEPGDIPALADLARRTWTDAFGWSVSDADQAAELETQRSPAYFEEALRAYTILVAEQEGRMVGYVQFGDVEIAGVDAGPGDQELHRLYVDTELHGGGVGRTLMDAALAHPRLVSAARIYLQVWHRNERAIRLYESLGFGVVGTTTFRIGVGELAEDLVMLRS